MASKNADYLYRKSLLTTYPSKTQDWKLNDKRFECYLFSIYLTRSFLSLLSYLSWTTADHCGLHCLRNIALWLLVGFEKYIPLIMTKSDKKKKQSISFLSFPSLSVILVVFFVFPSQSAPEG